MFDIIVVREGMLAECYGAYLWSVVKGCKFLTTPPLTQMEKADLAVIRDKNILIVGGYYRDNMEPIVEAAKEVTVFYNSSDVIRNVPPHELLTPLEFTGFLTWTIEQLSIEDEHILLIGRYLDEYLYGYPSDESLYFQKGVYTIDKDTDLNKLLTIRCVEDMVNILVKGQEKTIGDRRIAEQRCKSAKEFTFELEGKSYSALVTIGDSPIVETCLLLAKKSSSGVGMLFRYDISTGKTFISTRSTKESGIDAGVLMNKLVKGGGSKVMGGGSISKLVFPDQLLV